MPLRPATPVTRFTTTPSLVERATSSFKGTTSSFKGFDGSPALAHLLGAQALRETNHHLADTLTEAAGQARQAGGEADEKAYFG